MKVLANAIRVTATAIWFGALVAFIVFPTTSILAMYGLAAVVCAWLGLMRAADTIEAKQPQRPKRPSGGSLTDYMENAILDRHAPGARWSKSKGWDAPSYPTAFDGLPDAVKGPLLVARGAYVASDAPDAIVDYEARVAAILNPKPPAAPREWVAPPSGTIQSVVCRDCETATDGTGWVQRYCGGACRTIIDAASGEVIFPGETVTNRTLDRSDEQY